MRRCGDQWIAGAGRDPLIGGQGRDVLLAAAQSGRGSILVGGSIAHDADERPLRAALTVVMGRRTTSLLASVCRQKIDTAAVHNAEVNSR